METIQDLLDPANDNISIVEDPKTGDVSLPGATLVEIRDQESFVELLRLGEAHRFAANTKLNTESSRSHAILMVNELTCFLFVIIMPFYSYELLCFVPFCNILPHSELIVHLIYRCMLRDLSREKIRHSQVKMAITHT